MEFFCFKAFEKSLSDLEMLFLNNNEISDNGLICLRFLKLLFFKILIFLAWPSMKRKTK